jgi:cystathionine gamma-synthase
MSSDKKLKPETLAISAGRPVPQPDGELNTPIALNSTFHAGGPIGYGRYGNETWTALESAISALEGGQTLAFASGQSAASAIFNLLPIGAPVVVSDEGYQGIASLLKGYHEIGRLEVRFVEATNTAEVLEAAKGAALLWLESPTNPALEAVDLKTIMAGAKKLGVGVAVDNTLATPLTQKPLEFGADMVMHSVTKYFAGHSDVILGSISTNDPALYKRLGDIRKLSGGIPGPFEAWLALRGIRTFPLRFRAAEANAKELVKRLGGHSKVSKVRYPGFGAMISFELTCDAAGTDLVTQSATIITNTTSLGGVESMWERRRRWATESHKISESLIRFSVGCEDVDDLWDDIAASLGKI